MKKIKTLRGYIIAETKDHPHGYTILVFTKEEYAYGDGCRYPEWECDSIEEALEWIRSA